MQHKKLRKIDAILAKDRARKLKWEKREKAKQTKGEN